MKAQVTGGAQEGWLYVEENDIHKSWNWFWKLCLERLEEFEGLKLWFECWEFNTTLCFQRSILTVLHAGISDRGTSITHTQSEAKEQGRSYHWGHLGHFTGIYLFIFLYICMF